MKLAQIGISPAIITFVAWMGDRWRHLAGLVSAMPLIIPLTMWIVFTNAGHDYQKTAEFAGGAVVGVLGTAVFSIICYFLLRARLHFALVLAGGYAGWALAVLLLPQLIQYASRWATWLHK